MEKDLDEEDGALLGLYSGILERFIAGGTNSNTHSTNGLAQPRDKTSSPPNGPRKLEFQKPARKSLDVKE
jgi:hypothetical protein